MIVLTLGKVPIKLDFSFFAAMSLFFFFDRTGSGWLSLACCLCHELGHISAMLFVDAPLREILFYGAGIRITAELKGCGFSQRMAVYLAGCFVNFILSAVFFLLGEYLFSAINLVTGLFNLLPISHLDGAAVLNLLAEKHRRMDFLSTAAKLISAALLIFGLVFALVNPTELPLSFLLTGVYLLFMVLIS